jgi:alginate O-acetyltransferase complex protein AlgI
MKFDSLQFIGFILFSVLVLRIARGGWYRSFSIALLNCYFLYSFSSNLTSLTPLLLFVLSGYIAILIAEKQSTSTGIGVLLISLIAVFIWLKHYSVISFLPTLAFPYVTVGLSYILFRIIHLIVDVAQGAIKAPSVIAYLNYVFFFLNFVSGPIQRFQDFSFQTSHPESCETSVDVNSALVRVITGFFMVIVVCSYTSFLSEKLAKYFYIALSTGLDIKTLVLFAAAALAQLIHLYINFAGYMHICIGFGRLAGYSLPENFDEPYKAKNFLDLWARWHITLSEWFKFYLFNPVLKVLVGRWGSSNGQHAQYFGAAAFFVTFVTMGIWHGSTNIFVFYGLLLGLGVTVNKVWQIQMMKHFGKKRYKELCHQAWYSRLSTSFALSFFAVALTCIWIDPVQVSSMASVRGFLCGFLTLLMLCVLLCSFFWLATLLQPITRLKDSFFVSGDVPTAAITGFLLLLLLNFVVVVGSGAPEFIYKAF